MPEDSTTGCPEDCGFGRKEEEIAEFMIPRAEDADKAAVEWLLSHGYKRSH